MRKLISIILSTLILINIMNIFPTEVYAENSIEHYKGLPVTDPDHIPSNVPAASANGCSFDDKYWTDDNYHFIVYGTPQDVERKLGIKNDNKKSINYGTDEFRYLGFDVAGNPFSNDRFPDDENSGRPMASKNWIISPWNELKFYPSDYSTDDDFEGHINTMTKSLGWSPGNGGAFFGFGEVQSYPTMKATGSFRMWHRTASGKLWYDTQIIPVITERFYPIDSPEVTPFKVTTEILSNDFTIEEDETTVNVSVKVTAKLWDDSFYSNEIERAKRYSRDDIKKWDLTLEYKGIKVHIEKSTDGTNTATATFPIQLSRNQIADKEKVLFNGVGRVTFYNNEYLREVDTITQTFYVLNPPPGVELPPDLSITAPAKVNIKESYMVKVNPVVPQGESIRSVVLEAGVNGGAYQPIVLSNYSASQQYNSIGTINYRTTVTLNNNKTATATATTNVVDERSSTATAKVELPSSAYEGHWFNVRNKNTFTFEGSTYNAVDAYNLGLGSSDFEIQDNSEYPLPANTYQTRNYNSSTGFDMKSNETGMKKITIYALPKNGEGVTDTRGIEILSCPAIVASVDGTRKSNRKMILDFSRTVTNPDYPLVVGKTYAVIEDTVTGEKVTVTNSVNPDSTNIKTNALSGNKMDFLIKTSIDRKYKATIYVEDTRGNSDEHSITFTVVPDKAPIAKISTKEQELRKPSLSKKAEIFLQDDSYSEDGDYVTRTWEVACDTNNNGIFTDEAYYAINLYEGFQDLSGDGSQKKVRFLKTGVGKFNARVKAKEAFGQPTIDAFVTAADRRENTITKAVDVINVAPVVDFKMFSNVSTTINLIVGNLADSLQSSVQNSVAQMQSQLLSNKITPTINFIAQSFNTNRPVWNQEGGNSQNTGRSQFNGVLNSNIKWQYTTDITGGNDLCPDTDMAITPEGNILLLVPSSNELRLISKDGTLRKSLHITNSYSRFGILSDGRILLSRSTSSYPVNSYIDVYDKDLNFLSTINLPQQILCYPNFMIGNDNRIYCIIGYYSANYYYNYLYVLNQDLSVKTYSYLGQSGSGGGGAEILVDGEGNTYTSFYNSGTYTIYKFDMNGNQVWSSYNVRMNLLAFDETDKVIYGGYSNNGKKYLMKLDASTGQLLYQRQVSFENISHISIYGNHIYVSDYYRVQVVRKDNLSVDTSISTNGYVAGPGANKAIISKDGQVFTYSREEDSAHLSQYGQPSRTMYNLAGNAGGSTVVLSSGVFSSNNTLYLAGAYVTGTNSHSQSLCNSNLFVVAFGTGGTEQNTDNTLRKLTDYIPANGTRDFTVSITDSAFQDNAETNIANTANLLKAYNDNFFMIGGGSSLPDGQRILNYGTGGNLYWLDSNMWNPLSAITNVIVSTISPTPTQRAYEYYYDKGEIINYDAFYSDYELDPSQYSWWRYVHTPYTDGYFPYSGQWLGSPVTQFNQNGTYVVQHLQADSTGVPSYDKQSNIAEMIIHIGDGVVIQPPAAHTPEGSIELNGSYKQNRKLTVKLNYSSNNAYPLGGVYWTLTPLGGMGANDIKYTALTGQAIDTLYKLPGWVRATCSFHDSLGYWNTITKDYYIDPDLPPTGTLQVTPVTQRKSNGIATINVKTDITSPDDYIESLVYYIIYDADNNGTFGNDAWTHLPQFNNLREFNIDVNTGVGNYLVYLVAQEGFKEPTLPAFIVSSDYLSIHLQGASKVDNIAPAYDVKPEKSVYLVGEEIKFKSYDGSLLNGDNSKGFFDSENDPMTGFEVRYAQNKAIMPIQDATSIYTGSTIDYMSTTLDWRDINIWDISYNGGSIVWDSTYQAWKITGDIYMYLKPQYAARIDPKCSYYMEVKVLRQNDSGKVFYWGGDRLNSNKQHLEGYWGTYDYTASVASLPAVGSWVTYGATKAGSAATQYGWGSDCAYYRVGGLINYNGHSNQVTYIKDIKFITPTAVSGFAKSLDRAGEYTIDANAFDDPKAGDIRFDSYKKASNTSSNKIIVHRRPVAALSFTASHATAPTYNFGNNMYLDGTQLRISDISSDPDGFGVTSTISYKADSGNYVQLYSGNSINLYYGSVFTIKVVTTDNWGASDTAIYTISVVNGLDMVPEVIPYSVPASENVTLRLTTNQYASSARVVILGQNVNLPLRSQTATQKIWETIYNIPATRVDGVYTAQFYAFSEGMVEIRADKNFQVITPINLVPGMPAEAINNSEIIINATTSIYANTTTVQLFRGTTYQTSALSMDPSANGSSKNWVVQYFIPADIPVGNYTARFTSTTLNGNIEIRDVIFRVESLKITGVTISGYWNHWRGQVDMFGKQMSIEPHRFLSLEKVRIDVDTTGYADKVEIAFSPELESMQFTDQEGNVYDYFRDYDLQYVYFPASFNLDSDQLINHVHWEYTLPLAPSTVGWDDLRKKLQYSMTVTAWKGNYSATYTVNDIDITGNIYDLTYIQPVD